MKEYKKILDSYCSIRPVVKNDVHVRIPEEFFKWTARTELKDGYRKGVKLDALAVYTTLRRQGPSWRMKKDSVWSRIIEDGLGIGRTRVEKALKLLNEHGWIRYVKLKMPDGPVKGSFIEAQWRQLPKRSWANDRILRFHKGFGGFNVYERDGTPVPPEAYQPDKTDKTVNRASQDKLDNADETRAKGASVKRPISSDYRKSVDSDPVDSSSEDRYKTISIKNPSTPSEEGDDSSVPLGEELEPGPMGPGSVVGLTGESYSPGVDEEVNCEGALPGALNTLAIDWWWVREAAVYARNSTVHRTAYHKYLVSKVFPALQDPPTDRGQWKAAENVEWCRTSAKGQFLLSCAVEDDWPEDLARRFRKSASACSLAECKMVLRTSEFAFGGLRELKALVPGDRKLECGAAWKEMVKAATKRDDSLRENVERRLDNFPSRVRMNDRLMAESVRLVDLALKEDCLAPYTTQDDASLFFNLLAIHSQQSVGSVPPDPPSWVQENHDEISGRMARFVASDKIGAATALRDGYPAEQIWGFTWDRVKIEHQNVADELKLSAELYGIDGSITSDLDMFEQGPGLDPNTRKALTELARERRERAAAASNNLFR